MNGTDQVQSRPPLGFPHSGITEGPPDDEKALESDEDDEQGGGGGGRADDAVGEQLKSGSGGEITKKGVIRSMIEVKIRRTNGGNDRPDGK